MDKLIIDCGSGERQTAPLSAEDTAARDRVAAKAEQERQREDARAQVRQQGIDAFRDLVALAKDTSQSAIVRRVCRDTALALRALYAEVQDDAV